jgi:alkanesulfonate monooxygenase SsuD/methylene tetrahydromethanopterin reductase-like flavin-dependent oxidoreductase (luciferase family)
VGVGSLPEEHGVVSSVPYAARGRYADEFLQVMLALWTEERPTFGGEFFAFEASPASPRPRQQPHPPLAIGGNKPAALRRTARFGQSWHALAPSPEGMAQRLAALDEALAAAGRSRSDVAISLRADLHLQDSPSADDARGAGLRGDADQVVERLGRYAEIGVEELVVSVPSGELDHQRHQLETFAERVMPRFRTS